MNKARWTRHPYGDARRLTTSPTVTGRYRRDEQEVTQAEPEATRTPAHGTYGGLLFDPRWKTRRAEIISRDQECCVICQSRSDLQIHHRQYLFVQQLNAFKMPWDYPDHLLITLCKSCHQRGHSKFKVPTIII